MPDLPCEKLIIKIWDTLFDHFAVGLARPRQIRREAMARADARRHESLSLAQTERDVQDIVAGRRLLDSQGRLVALPSPEGASDRSGSEFLLAADRESRGREIRRTANIRRIAYFAEEEAERVAATEVVSADPIDPDWFSRWRESAQDVSREELQRLWARVLAGEAKKPGRFSLHSLDFLRRVSKEDAERISDVSRRLFLRDFIYKSRTLGGQDVSDLGFDTVQSIQELV